MSVKTAQGDVLAEYGDAFDHDLAKESGGFGVCYWCHGRCELATCHWDDLPGGFRLPICPRDAREVPMHCRELAYHETIREIVAGGKGIGLKARIRAALLTLRGRPVTA